MIAHSPSKCVSSPNLLTGNEDERHVNVNVRKRKQPELEGNISDAINTIMQTMQCSFKEMNEKIDNSALDIKKHIQDDIMSELNKVSSTTEDIKKDLNTLRTEYADMRGIMAAMNSKQLETTASIESLKTSIEFTSERVDDIDKRVKMTEIKLKHSDDMNTELLELKKSLSEMKLELHGQQQRDRQKNLEIHGLPESNSENLEDIFIRIASHAGVTISSNDIDHIHRVQPRKSIADRSRAVVVKLKQRIHKDNVIVGIRKTRGISTKDLNMGGNPKPIYVNEHLTVNNKTLLKKCKEMATIKQFQYVWVKNCRIYIRKHDNAPLAVINCEEDLKKFH